MSTCPACGEKLVRTKDNLIGGNVLREYIDACPHGHYERGITWDIHCVWMPRWKRYPHATWIRFTRWLKNRKREG